MPYDSRTYRVLIASPSDVEEEREIAVRVIQDWNDQFSYPRKAVLLPLRWETHTAPEYGTRPQEVINREIVDQCDLLVGMFWTRVGTPTGVADSGTLEEITRTAKAGKPVMLYFSRVGVDPDRINLEQLARLKEFKDSISSNALTESYKSLIEFRDKLAKQLELKVRELQKDDDSGQPPPLQMAFICDPGSPCEAVIQREVELPVVPDFEAQISGEKPEVVQKIKEALLQRTEHSLTVPVLLQISNTGSSGVRNLFVELLIQAESPNVEVSDPTYVLNTIATPWRYPQFYPMHLGFSLPWATTPVALPAPVPETSQQEGLSKVESGWKISFEWDALQPKRTRRIHQKLLVRSRESTKVHFRARVFADSFPAPVPLDATLEIVVHPKAALLEALLPNLDALKKEALAQAEQAKAGKLKSAAKTGGSPTDK